jgi:hypothetical protein
MTRGISDRRYRPWLILGAAMLLAGSLTEATYADEGGVSFWLPGQFGSLAAAPGVPGWSGAAVYYHTPVAASGAVAAAREIEIGRFSPAVKVNLNANLNAQADLLLLNPTYTFATPVLGGQLALGVTGIFGRSSADINGTLTAAVGPLVATRMGSIGDSLTSVGDLYPMATLKWNAGVHNFMTYVTGDIPVGAYDPTRLANIGIGHGAIDGGGGYTYFNPQTGHEVSAVAGFTYNFKNQDTQYQNGADFHLDWGCFPISLGTIFCRPRRICVSTGHGRLWSKPDSGWLPVTCPRYRPSDWIPVPHWKYAGLSESEGIWRIRCGKSAVRLEYVADVLDLSNGSHQHRNADTALGDKVRELI